MINTQASVVSYYRLFHLLLQIFFNPFSILFLTGLWLFIGNLLATISPSHRDLCLRPHLLSGKVNQNLYCSKISPLISHYLKHMLTTWPNNSTPKYLLKTSGSTCQCNDLCMSVLSNFIHNSPKLEMTQFPLVGKT